MTNAQRQAKYWKAHVRVRVDDRIGSTVKALAESFGFFEVEVTRELIRFALANKNWWIDGFPIQRTPIPDSFLSTNDGCGNVARIFNRPLHP